MKGIKINKAELIVSIDDYDPLNMRLADLFGRLKIPAIFFIETIRREARDQIRQLHELGFEIGNHTLHHVPDLKALNVEECRAELQISKQQIEDITGKDCEVIAWPRGRFNDQVIEIAEKAGFKEARTTHVLRTEAASDPFRTPTTIHMYDGRKEYAGRPWLTMADFYWDDVSRRGGIFHIWGHAEEIDRFNQWQMVENFFKKIIA